MYPWIRKNNDEPLNEITKNGVTWLSFPALEKTGMVKHAFSTRMGGVSKAEDVIELMLAGMRP